MSGKKKKELEEKDVDVSLDDNDAPNISEYDFVEYASCKERVPLDSEYSISDLPPVDFEMPVPSEAKAPKNSSD